MPPCLSDFSVPLLPNTQERRVEITSGTCVWYHSGMPAVPIRWVLIRDPEEKFETQALLSTKLEAAPEQIVRWFVMRWQVEVTFEETRAHLGLETQRQWSDLAIGRTTPSLLGLYSIVTLMAKGLHERQSIKARSEAWYSKESATFSDTIAVVRRCLWSQQSFQISEKESEMVKVSRALLERFTDALCYAA